ncbi:MAG: cell wall hydrolase [Oscillospiraceae bacterium]
MLKRISCLALSMVLLLGVLVQQVTAMEGSSILEPFTDAEEAAVSEQPTAEAEESIVPDEQADEPSGPSILVDGVVVEDAAPSIYQQTTYVSLRSVVMALRPDATVTWEGDHAAVTAEGLTISVYPSKCYLVANGRYLYLPYGVRMEDGRTMLPVRVLAQALGAQVQWDSTTGNVLVTSGTGAIVSGDEYYDADELYWLSHIIYAESGNQPLSGKIGVGNVILNRVKSALFPNSIYGVIFQKNQFTPASSGSIYKQPNAESVIAAKLCLDGAVVLPNALWFNRAGCSSWASRNKSYIATIGAHSFYA